MRVLVTGARGLLGAAIVREFTARSADVVALDRAALDITDAAGVSRVVSGAGPDVVINCVGYNDVDDAESNAVTALDVNAIAVRTLARAAEAAGARYVHYSSDFVFDGGASRPYTEDDQPNPRSVYGASKLLGEWFALEHSRADVLRVESLCGTPGPGGSRHGSLGTIVARIRAGEPVPVFVDRTVSPSYTVDVAHATAELLEAHIPFGLYHCVNSGAITWQAIATEAAELIGLPARIQPITLEQAVLKASRPKYCALSNARLAAAGVPMPPWQDALRRHLGG